MNPKKKVLFISYDGLSDPVGQSQIIPYFEYLSNKGYGISILSFEKAERIDASKELIIRRLSDANINWYPLKYTKKPPVISTLLDFRKMRKEAARICQKEKIELIHARSYIPALAALSLKKELKIPFIFDMRGFWADERIDGKIWSLKNPLYKIIFRFFKIKEQKLLKNADSIVSLTRNAATYMSENWGTEASKITVIPCAADYFHFNPEKIEEEVKTKVREDLKIPDSSTILFYHGSIGTWYLAEPMLDFFRLMREMIPDAYFLWCTNEDPDKLRMMAEERKINDRIILKSQVTREEMPAYLSLADYCIMFIKPSFSKKASSPIKYAESLAMNKPVICNAGVGDLAENEINGYGVLINDLNVAEYQSALERIMQTNYITTSIRENSRTEFDLGINSERYASLYDKITRD